MDEKNFYIDKMKNNLRKLSNIKTDILMTQNCIMDEGFYTDEIENAFEVVDIALEDAKEEISDLIALMES